ncbi:MAG: transcriptional regulator [Firmicutes bacterium]|nr:transcriptional regulator [Bacillota bacterium]
MSQTPLPHDHGDALGLVLEHMPEEEEFARGAETFRQLGDPSRLRLLWLLCHCEDCGINLAAALGMSHAAVSHHLKVLRLNGLITSHRSGKEIYYTLADTETARLVHRMIDDLFRLTCPTKGL